MAFADTVPPLPRWLVSELPFNRRSYRLERGRDAGRHVHLIDEGDPASPAVLLLHGNPTWSFLWRKVIAQLERRRCVAPDLLGLGLSDRLPGIADHDVDRHADAIAEVVEALDLRAAVFVGQDWGGPIIAAVAARLPGRVGGAVFANTSILVPARPRGTAFHRFSRLPLISDFVFRVLGFPQIGLKRIQGDPRSISGKVARAYRWPLRRFSDRVAPLAMARMVPDGPEHPSVAALRRGEAWARGFEGPIALVWGMKDPILGRALRRHAEAFPTATVRRVERAGHFLQEEVPELLAAAVREVSERG